MATIKVEIVSAEKALYSGEAEMFFAPANMGEVGVTPGHAPLLTSLSPGEVRVKHTDGSEEAFYVSGGMLEIQPNVVTVLSDTGVRAEDLDEAAVMKAKEEAERAFHDRESEMDYATAEAQLAETIAQLQTIQRMRKRAGR